MFGFGEVGTHLGVVLINALRLFEGFWLDLWKMEEISKIWAISGVLRRGIGIPKKQRRSTPRRGMSTLQCGREKAWASLGYAAALRSNAMPQRSYCS